MKAYFAADNVHDHVDGLFGNKKNLKPFTDFSSTQSTEGDNTGKYLL